MTQRMHSDIVKKFSPEMPTFFVNSISLPFRSCPSLEIFLSGEANIDDEEGDMDGEGLEEADDDEDEAPGQ